MNAHYWIKQLDLTEHPEGGYFREVYRSEHRIAADALPEGFDEDHRLATSIYFLLTADRPSRLHRLHADELWHFHTGSSVTLHLLEEGGRYRQLKLGTDPGSGESFQQIVPAGTWFGATVEEPGGFGLVGCTVFPGFEFSDFELGDRSELLRTFPAHNTLIERLTAPEQT